MLWPLLTVLLVFSIFYLDRVYSFKMQTLRQEDIRLESLQLLLQDRNQSITSDLQFLGNHQALKTHLDEVLPLSSALVTELFEHFLSGKKRYARIRLLNRGGKELLARSNNGGHLETAGSYLSSFETPSFFEILLRQQRGKIYQLAISPENTENNPQAVQQDIVQRLYYVIVDNQDDPAGFVTLDYRSLDIFKPLYDTGQERIGRVLLLDRDSARVITGETIGAGAAESSRKKTSPAIGKPALYADLLDELSARIALQPSGHFFIADTLYVYRSLRPFPHEVMDVHAGSPGNAHLHGEEDPDHWFLVTEVENSYFAAQKKYYLKLLALLGVILLVPSFFVCLFLAKSRARVKLEAALRYREHTDHLEQLEEKVRQRTQELDEINLQLGAEIVERLAAERQMRLNNELLSGIIGSIDGIVYVADFDSHEILFANDYLKELFGFDPVGRLCWQFLQAKQDGPCSFCTNHRLLDETGNPAPPVQWEYENPYNKRWYAAKDQAIRWSNGKYVRLEIATDITEQKRLQHFLQEARRQAELARGIHSRFVALVAHDLKSPFFSITQMLQRILDRETFTYRIHRQFLENIVENGHRMLQMIDNLLSIDRFETGEIKLDRKFFDVSLMADEVLQNFRHAAAEKNLTLNNEIPAETLLYADRYLYYIVLNNLVSNAIKFSEQYGRIILAADGSDRLATIVVRDNGKGMSEDYIQNLFRADVKTSRQGTHGEQGSGLGLIFCLDIIKAHLGNIRVESEQGLGTSFYVELPQCSSIEAHQQKKPETA